MEKDSPDRRYSFGFVVPGLILLIVVLNLITGKVYTPRRFVVTFPLLAAYTDAWRFWGVVLLKLGMAAGMFTWFILANYEKCERWYVPVLIGSVSVAVVGLVLYAFGFFA